MFFQEPIEGADDLKSVNEMTAEICCIQLCNAMRKQIEDIEYFILKVKGYCAQMKTGGQNEDDRKLCESRMVTTERGICAQLIFISRVCIHLGNAMQPVGTCTDNYTKLLIQLYVCLANLTKHFIIRQKISPISYKSTKFDQLVQTIGKKLPLKVYAMISYIEDNIFAHENEEENEDDAAPKRSKKKVPKNQKAKVMRDTKNIPKLILRIENFNKFVISLSKKTEHDLSKCLHLGTVRDFRIKSSALREAIDKIRQNESEDNEDDESVENETNNSDDDNDDDDDEEEVTENEAVSVTETNSTNSTSSVAASTGSIINEIQHDTSLRTSVMKNMNVINKRVNKRKKQDTDNVDEPTENDTNQRRKKRKENKPIDSTPPPPPPPSASTSTRRSSRRNPSK